MRLASVVCLLMLACGHHPASGLPATLSAEADPRPHLAVMAYNVLFHGARNADSLKTIAAESPDVVCLTELTQPFIDAFAAKFPADYRHRAFAPKVGTHGVGLASRWPIRAWRTYAVAPARIPALEATVEVDGAPLQVACVHLMPPTGFGGLALGSWNGDVRAAQGAFLVKRLAGVKGPALVLGDFNEEPGGPALAALEKAGFVRACDGPGSSCGATFPGPVVPQRPAVFIIAHVLGRAVRLTHARTVRAGGSDHYPVMATVRLSPLPRR